MPHGLMFVHSSYTTAVYVLYVSAPANSAGPTGSVARRCSSQLCLVLWTGKNPALSQPVTTHFQQPTSKRAMGEKAATRTGRPWLTESPVWLHVDTVVCDLLLDKAAVFTVSCTANLEVNWKKRSFAWREWVNSSILFVQFWIIIASVTSGT